MALKINYPDRAEIPEEFRKLYTENENGVWNLTGIEGIRSESEFQKLESLLEEERKNAKQDPELLGNLKAECTALREKLENANMKLEEFSQKERVLRIEKALRDAAEKHGVRPEAVSDVLARASVFEISREDSSVISRSGSEILSPDAWLEKQLKISPHWLAPSRSAGLRPAGEKTFYKHSPNIHDIIRDSWNKQKWSV